MIEQFEYELGDVVESTVTGFKGTVTARIQYLEGSTQYMVSAQVNELGQAPERWEQEGSLMASE